MERMSEGYAYRLNAADQWSEAEIVVAPNEDVATSVGVGVHSINGTLCVTFATASGAMYAQAISSVLNVHPAKRVDVLVLARDEMVTIDDLGAFVRDNDFGPEMFNRLAAMNVGDRLQVAGGAAPEAWLQRYA